ncbi:hypothetical protein BDV93DRAFT_520979 [Ceratobasidium sp. AG-I]|nr:hypothetical protein BDV93DRAFT_520979 [Ceratobasidium sp. AG-I]
MFKNHFARISSASEALACSMREFSAALSDFGSEVESYYKSGLLNDRMRLRNLASAVDGPLETIALHASHLRLVRTSLRKTRNKTIPINSLHPELLARIFSFISSSPPSVDIFGSYPEDLHNPEVAAKRASLKKTLVVSSVCEYWRHITLGTGTLWTFIPIHLSGKAAQLALHSALVWLDRAQTTPLDVCIDMALGETPTSRAMLDKVIALPLHSKRTHALFLSLGTTTHLNTLLKNCFSDGVSVTLKRLQLEVYGQIDEPSILQNWLSRCQELQVLQLSIDALHDDRFPVLPKLVELRLCSLIQTPLTTERLSNILCACPGLERLELNDIELENSTGVNLAPVPLSYLNALVLQYVDASIILPLISPTSRSLSLSITGTNLDLSNNNLGYHLSVLSSQATITAFQLYAGALQWQDLHNFLCMFPHLLTLSLRYTLLNELIARTLRGTGELGTDEKTASSTFPSLDAIWLTECQIDEEEALRLLASLQPSKQLKLNYCYLPLNRMIMRSEDLCNYLLGAVSDLEIVDRDEDGEDVHFP